MDIETLREGTTLVAKPAGRMEGTTATDLKRVIDDAVTDDDEAILIDLTDLAYMSSAGLRTIARIHNDVRKTKSKTIALCSMTTAVKAVLTTSGFNKWMIMRDTRKEAMEAMAEVRAQASEDEQGIPA